MNCMVICMNIDQAREREILFKFAWVIKLEKHNFQS